MRSDADESGVVVVLENERLVLITGELCRDEAARFIRSARPVFPAIKFFPAQADTAAATIQKINQSGIVHRILVEEEALAFGDELSSGIDLDSFCPVPLPIRIAENHFRI